MSASSSSGSRRRSPRAIWASSVSIGTSELAMKAVAIMVMGNTRQGEKKTQGGGRRSADGADLAQFGSCGGIGPAGSGAAAIAANIGHVHPSQGPVRAHRYN